MYTLSIESNSTTGREFDVESDDIMGLAKEYGRCEGGENVSLYDGDELIARVAWTPEDGGYYYDCQL